MLKTMFLCPFLIFLVFFMPSMSLAQLTVANLWCENRSNPVGIEDLHPRLTWTLAGEGRNQSQSAYEIQVSKTKEFSGVKLFWESGKITSQESIHIPYQGPALRTLGKYHWRVRVWDENGTVSPWSQPAFWQNGILEDDAWKAQWIPVGYEEPSSRPAANMRHTFSLSKPVKSATAIITSQGLYHAFLNGSKIGNDYLTPGWTSYQKRLQYQVYDISEQLQEGENTLGATLGSGWFRGNLVWQSRNDFFGNELALLLQVVVEFEDGTIEIIGTDENWKSKESAILSSEIYHGETVDGRKQSSDWLKPNYDDSNWDGVEIRDFGYDHLVATDNEPVKKQEVIQPIKIITTPEGDKVLDFGQNLVGFVTVDISGNRGDSLILEHAEVLDREGNFYTTNLRAAKQRNKYILSGNRDHFEPQFTWQGFRYARIGGNATAYSMDDFKAVVLYSDMHQTGEFSTSDTLLNQLQHNIQWGQKGNFLDIPTDCPQRDERLGWTGDAQVFFRTAAYNMNVNNFFAKWMKDVAADQLDNGAVPHVIPNVLGESAAGSAGWADVATIIPWDMYLLYGDTKILEQQYESMKAWVDFMNAESKNNLWNTGFHFGDWLFYRPDDDTDGRSAITDKYLIAQCFFAHSTQLLINAAEVLGKPDDQQQYSQLLGDIKAAFVKEYMTPNGRLVSGSQTAYVLALHFDMLPASLRQQAADRLADNVRKYDYHLTTGFLGTPYLCHVLSRFGYKDLAFTLLMQQTYPSWLYPVTQGATTIWERWDGQKPDGTFQNPGMNSFNHYAYGAIGDWMYRELAGINASEKPGEVGYKKVILKPHWYFEYQSEKISKQNNDKLLSEVNASLKTYYGTIVSHWQKALQGQYTYTVNIPVNTSAEIHLPTGHSEKNIKENGTPLSEAKDIKIVETNKNTTVVSLGSGTYTFTIE
ncbi:Bacterial alpha-L-rhamnosidase [Echinicola soli]|uniref:alpha-L-rhamnosidase n=1 Tax=Echinicola soli TaxID=2591634 RepID=A0A514CJR0_9BACT|nr:alpha-L-rhamnosidase [Echinicola soli]QDH79884.1 Bacterial alpha-L-rhamnosidase [Echinicola soli]